MALDTKVPNLGKCRTPSPLLRSVQNASGFFVQEGAAVRYSVETGTGRDLPADVLFEKAGAREQIFFDPQKTNVAIVTCGGLCPGLNNVIRSVVRELYLNYGVENVWGVPYGYMGLNPKVGEPLIRLTPENVDRIHEKGGTVLGSSRGKQPYDVMADFLYKQKINILIVIGGDGTLRGANETADAISRKGWPISVIGVPKTIDNDVMYMTRTFGLATAADISRSILSCAHVEAQGAYNGVGLVKLMGRDCGFVAAMAALASQDVNFCLIPEIPIVLDGPNGFLEHLRKRLEKKRHAVVVVAEGAGQELMAQLPSEKDASGNKRYGDIGTHLKERITAYCKGLNMPCDVKYFDPSYLVRSAPANVDDAVLCDQLGRNAVHAAMAGRTRAVVGFLNGTFALIPFSLATSQKKYVDPQGALWTGVLAATGQPHNWENKKNISQKSNTLRKGVKNEKINDGSTTSRARPVHTHTVR